tara:strand:- start:5736 stop:7460 length:1725 start_codon:yes stop_codon:yes gene_type:complete
MTLSKLRVVLEASTSAFNRSMKKAQTRVKAFSARIKKLGVAMKAMASKIGIAVAALAGIGVGMKKVFDLGAGIEETGSKFATVFGPESAAQVQSFLDGFANKAGLTNAEAQALVSTTGAIAQGLGFTQKASGDMSIAITKLAADLSSFNNLPTEQVLMAVNSALTGEREQLKQLGIVIKETDVQQLAFAQTGKTAAAALTSQEKATATLALITKNAGVAIGDLNRTQGSAANVAKRLGAMFKEVRDAIATALMPAFRDLLSQITEHEGKFQQMKQAIIENTGVISAWASVFFAALKSVGQSLVLVVRLVANLAQNFVNLLQAAKAFFTGDWGRVKQEFIDSLKNVGDIVDAIGDTIETAADFWVVLGDAIFGTHEKAEALASSFVNVGVTGTEAADAIAAAIEETSETIESLRDKLDSLTERMASDFVNRMTNAAQGGKDAFQGFFDYMKNRLIELAMQWALFKTLTGIFGESDFLTALTGFGSGTPGPVSSAMQTADLGGIGGLRPKAPHLITARSGVSQSGMTVNQTINFTVSAIDSQDASRFIQQQKGAIAGVMAEATRNSRAYRRQLVGV